MQYGRSVGKKVYLNNFSVQFLALCKQEQRK